MKKALFFFSFAVALLGLVDSAHARLCLISHESDSAGNAYSLRYHVNLISRVEREAPCTPVADTLDEWLFVDEDDPAGSNQVIWFATRQMGGYLRSTGPVDEIVLGSPLVFNNSSVTMVIGNAPRSFLDENAYDYDYRDDFDPTVHVPRNYGIVTLDARSAFDEAESPFTCGSGADEVVLRNFIINTHKITKDDLFTTNSCLRDGGTVYVCPGVLRTVPWNQPDDLIDITQFTPEQIANAWCDQDADDFNTMEDDCNDFEETINPDADEICGNDIDENCNDVLDDGCACMPGENRDCGFPDVGACEPGTQKCEANGQWGECIGGRGPTPEVCDVAISPELPVDEDCDGEANEGCLCVPGSTQDCGPDAGACEFGTQTCAADGLSWGACTGGVGPVAETCDGTEDEDCDGTVDEGCFCTNGSTRSCGTTDVGACAFGLQTCFAGGWGACAGAIEPSPEVCGGAIDENCDGAVNEVCVCVPGEERTCGLATGACVEGTETCSADGSSWGACTGGVGPAAEVCDTLDNDCDGAIDEADATNPRTWYADADVDTYGNAAVVSMACNQPAGTVTDNTDCDDTNPLINPRAAEVCGNGFDDDCDGTTDELPTWYQDADGDSYGNFAVQIADCLRPGGYVDNSDDCDDTRASVHPLGLEICADGIDQNCDGTDPICPAVDEDGDGDGYCPDLDRNGLCTDGSMPLDCNDADISIHPGASEVCGDGIDQNCDTVDPGCVVDVDNDGDGYCDDSNRDGVCNDGTAVGDCNDAVATINPAAIETCDGLDNNCDGVIDEASAADATTWYADIDGDTYGNPAFSIISCSRILRFVPDFTDCNDSSAGINPAAIEICDDAIDQDCSGADLPCVPAADTDDDGDGFCEDSDGDGTCTDGARPGDCNDANAAINPDATEICDGIDNNCDRIVDLVLADDDGDGYFSSCPRDCVDSDGTINPAALEVCGDGFDNNCDGMDLACPEEPDDDDDEDEDDEEEEPEDKDDDDFTVDFDCNDLNKNVNANAAEICDGIDNNCDGLVDFADPDGDGFFGPCPIDCNNADGTIYPGAMEICFDDIDNNCNEVTDEGCVIEPPIDCTNPTFAATSPTCDVSEPEVPEEPVVPDEEPDAQEIVPPGGFPAAIHGGGGCGLSASSSGDVSWALMLLGFPPLVFVSRRRRSVKNTYKFQ